MSSIKKSMRQILLPRWYQNSTTSEEQIKILTAARRIRPSILHRLIITVYSQESIQDSRFFWVLFFVATTSLRAWFSVISCDGNVSKTYSCNYLQTYPLGGAILPLLALKRSKQSFLLLYNLDSIGFLVLY